MNGKRILSVLLVCTLIAMGLVVFENEFEIVGDAVGTTLYVPVSFSTIQSALDNASNGDTIIIGSGTYYENIVINKTIHLKGNSTYACKIDGSGSDAIIVSAPNVTISNMTVKNGNRCIVIHDTHGCNVTNCEITVSSGGEGISIKNSHGNNISYNRIEAMVGIRTYNSSFDIYYENDIFYDSFCNFLDIEKSHNLSLIKNTMGFFSPYPQGYVYIANSRNITDKYSMFSVYFGNILYDKISGLDIINYNCDFRESGGFYIQRSDHVNIISGNFQSESNIGVSLSQSSSLNFISNSVLSNNGHAFECSYSDNINIKSNTFYTDIYFGSYGAQFYHVDKMNFSSNEVNAALGIYSTYLTRSLIYNNTVKTVNTINGDGYYFTNSDNCTVTDNSASYRSRNGLYTLNCNDLIISGNELISASGSVSENNKGMIIIGNRNTVKNNSCDYGSYGIEITGNENKVQGNSLRRYNVGFAINGMNNLIEDNNISDQREDGGLVMGIYLSSSTLNNTIKGNIIDEANWGISLRSSLPNYIRDNRILNSKNVGIYLNSSKSQVIWNNSMNRGMLISGNLVSHWDTHTISVNNTVDGKPIYYIKNGVDSTISTSYGQVLLGNCKNVTISNQDISNRTVGIQIGFGESCIVEDSILQSSPNGIMLYSSANTTILNNTILDCGEGMNIHSGHGDSVFGNRFSGSISACRSISSGSLEFRDNFIEGNQKGFVLESCDDSMIMGNTFDNNSRDVETFWMGNSIISDNAFDHSPFNLMLYQSYNNTVTRNMEISIELHYCQANSIYHNSMVTGSDDSLLNNWNLDYPKGGNFWEDYEGKDFLKGPGQNLIGADGIGDDPYVISGGVNNKDHYPLMSPLGEEEEGGSIHITSHVSGDVINGVTVFEATITATKYLWVNWYVDGELNFTDADYPFQFIFDTKGMVEDSDIEITASLEFATLPCINSTVNITISNFVCLSGSFGFACTRSQTYRPDMVVTVNVSLNGSYQWFDLIEHELILHQPSGDVVTVGHHVCDQNNRWGFIFSLPSDVEEGAHTLEIGSKAYRHGTLLWMNNCSTKFTVTGQGIHDSLDNISNWDPMNDTVNQILKELRALQLDVNYINGSMNLNFMMMMEAISNAETSMLNRIDILEINLTSKLDGLNTTMQVGLTIAINQLLAELDDVDISISRLETDLGDLGIELDTVRSDILASIADHDTEIKKNLSSMSDLMEMRFVQLSLLVQVINATIHDHLKEMETDIEEFRLDTLENFLELMEYLREINGTIMEDNSHISEIIEDTRAICEGLYNHSYTLYGQLARDVLSRLDQLNSSEARRLKENLNSTLYAYGILNSSMQELTNEVKLAFEALQKLDDIITDIETVDNGLQVSEEEQEVRDDKFQLILIIILVVLLIVGILQIFIFIRLRRLSPVMVESTSDGQEPVKMEKIKQSPHLFKENLKRKGFKEKKENKQTQTDEESDIEELEEYDEMEEID